MKTCEFNDVFLNSCYIYNIMQTKFTVAQKRAEAWRSPRLLRLSQNCQLNRVAGRYPALGRISAMSYFSYYVCSHVLLICKFNCLRGWTDNILVCHVEVPGLIPGPREMFVWQAFIFVIFMCVHGIRNTRFPQWVFALFISLFFTYILPFTDNIS